MNVHKLEDFTRGWFIGNFEPSLFQTPNFEVGLQHHAAGTTGIPHRHEHSTEYNLIITGLVEIKDWGDQSPQARERVQKLCEAGDCISMKTWFLRPGNIFVYPPNHAGFARFITDTTLVVVRSASIPGDKVVLDV